MTIALRRRKKILMSSKDKRKHKENKLKLQQNLDA
jgi:hypothetical protein